MSQTLQNEPKEQSIAQPIQNHRRRNLISILHSDLPGYRAGQTLRPPATPGCKFLLQAQAKGVQIYKSDIGKDGKLEWTFDSPLANLFDSTGKKIAYHYEGPTWESTDGSKVSRDKEQQIQTLPAPDAKNDIPWLLVPVKPDPDKDGVLSKVAFVQRTNTHAGKAPTDPPLRAGTKIGVEYTATYCFFERGT